MKIFAVLIFVVLDLCGCSSRQAEARREYLALLEKTNHEYAESADRAYVAESHLVEYVERSLKAGRKFPDKSLLMWGYARVALAAECTGRSDEANRMYDAAEKIREEVYPGQPVDRSGKFKSLREETLFMERTAGTKWLK